MRPPKNQPQLELKQLNQRLLRRCLSVRSGTQVYQTMIERPSRHYGDPMVFAHGSHQLGDVTTLEFDI